MRQSPEEKDRSSRSGLIVIVAVGLLSLLFCLGSLALVFLVGA